MMDSMVMEMMMAGATVEDLYRELGIDPEELEEA